jgi:hypothetical protein
VLSESDHDALSSMLEQLRQTGKQIVGYYRSCTGRELALEESDKELIGKYLGESSSATLLIKPISIKECVASFLFRESTGVWIDLVECPRARAAGAAAAATAGAGHSRPEVPHAPSGLEANGGAQPPVASAAPAQISDRESLRPDELAHSASRATLWLWAALCVAVAGGGFAGYQWRKVAGEPRAASLGLDVQPAGTVMEVQWDRSSPAVRRATLGELFIADGPAQNTIELNQAAIARGNFAYAPSSGDVFFRLKMYTGGQPVMEAMRLVSGAQSRTGPKLMASTPTSSGSAQPQRSESSRDAIDEQERSSVKADAPRALQREEKTPAANVARKENLRAIVPAKVVYEVRPSVPEGIRSRIRGRIVVPVIVEISASGRVVKAIPQGHGDGVYRYLAQRAAAAAKAWRFQPAKGSGGATVPTAKTLYFTFDS